MNFAFLNILQKFYSATSIADYHCATKKYDPKVTLTKPSVLDGIWAADSESELRSALSRQDFKLFAFFDFTDLYDFVTEMPKLSLCSMVQRRFNNIQYTRKHNKINEKYCLFK